MEIYHPPTQEEFKAMSRKEKRIAVVRDALALAREKRLHPYQGRYLVFEPDDTVNELTKLDMQAMVTAAKPVHCDACIMGGLFLGLARIGNNATVPIHPYGRAFSVDDYDIVERFSGLFTESELRAVENYFEGDQDVDSDEEGYVDPYDLYVTICENMIANGGEFRP